jgi:hypothetical protein
MKNPDKIIVKTKISEPEVILFIGGKQYEKKKTGSMCYRPF